MTVPTPLKKAYDAWMTFSQMLGKVMSAIILTILWIIGFGTYSIIQTIGNLFTKKASSSTYWLDAEPASDMRRQF